MVYESKLRRALLALLVLLALGAVGMPFTAGENANPSLTAEAGGMKARRSSTTNDEVRIEYCTSCGFQQNFEQTRAYLEQKHPHLIGHVHGMNYAVDPIYRMVAQLMGYIQMAAMGLMLFGERLFRAMNWDMTLLQKALDKRVACFAVIMLMGSLSQSLVSTGAFEVHYNGELVFSKIQMGRWPSLDELSQMVSAN